MSTDTASTWLTLLAQWPGARWLQGSGTAYLVVNAAHILGLALLIGAILPLDLRLVRGTQSAAQVAALPLQLRTAATGLALALPTGAWLFSVQPQDYVGNPAFLTKMGLLGMALLNVALQHGSAGWRALRAGGLVPAGVRWRAGLSALLWVSVLLAGRWIGFA